MIAKYVPGTANNTAKSPNTNPYTATASHCGLWLVDTGKGADMGVVVEVEIGMRFFVVARERV
jgi:hypothetical protein